MGEVDENYKRRFNVSGWRGTIVRALTGAEIMKLQSFENEFIETLGRLKRMKQQRDVLRDEVGLYKSSVWNSLLVGDYNPDEIGYDEYKKMLNYDSQVIAGWDLITMGVLMKGWRINHPDPKIVTGITAMFQRLIQPSFRDAMKEMMKAIPYGFTTTEVVFDEWKGMWAIRHKNGLKTLDPEFINFFSDPYGNLLKIVERIGGETVDLPLFRTLVWTHDKEWGNFYGKSILRACYKNWFIKDAMLKFANIAYEQFGSPMLMGIARNIAEKDQIAESLDHLFARSKAVLVKHDENDPTDIKVIESKRTEMPFDRYIQYQDEMILRRMLIGQRIFEGGGGTYGPKIPFDIILMRFQDFRLELETIINELLILIADLNWPVKIYPKFEFEPLTTMDEAQLRQAIWDALDHEILDKDDETDIRYIRDQLRLPQKPIAKAKETEESEE